MRRPRPLTFAALVLSLGGVASACSAQGGTVALSGDPRAAASPTDIATFLANDADGRFTTLLSCASLAGADAAIGGTGPVTLFAPTNDAFEDAGISCEEGVELSDTERTTLLRTLQQHVVDYDVRFAPPEGYDPEKPPRLLELVDRDLTLDSILLDAPGTSLIIGEDGTVRTSANRSAVAEIVDRDLQAPNGIVQVIDAVLEPPAKPEFPPTTAAPQPYE